VEWVKYSAYGVPFGLPRGDTDSDGDCDETDQDSIDTWSSGYDVRFDLNLDGDIEESESTLASPASAGRSIASLIRNVKALNGSPYEYDKLTMRYRHLYARLGLWASRDPLGLRAGTGLYQAMGSNPTTYADSYGLYQQKLPPDPSP